MTVATTRLPAAERRQALIETAIRVFSEGSYRGTTTAEIARAAGISEPILYRHFASKRDLYLAALDHVWSNVRTAWERALGEAGEDPELRRHLGRHMREVHDFMADLIRRGQSEGVLHADRDADAEAWTFLSCGMLGMVGRRIGLLDEDEVARIRKARLDWLTA